LLKGGEASLSASSASTLAVLSSSGSGIVEVRRNHAKLKRRSTAHSSSSTARTINAGSNADNEGEREGRANRIRIVPTGSRWRNEMTPTSTHRDHASLLPSFYPIQKSAKLLPVNPCCRLESVSFVPLVPIEKSGITTLILGHIGPETGV
jgi:hypothetical protein